MKSPFMVPTTKCTPSDSAATQRTPLPASEGALESAVERPQLRGAVLRAADEARAAGSIATATVYCACMVSSHAPLRHTLMVLSYEPVMTRPSRAAATPLTVLVCPS